MYSIRINYVLHMYYVCIIILPDRTEFSINAKGVTQSHALSKKQKIRKQLFCNRGHKKNY
jgi:hypothetical protein